MRRPLSPRERRVLLLAANGATNEQIARELKISRMTVQRHLQNIREALGARDRTHAVALGIRLGAVVVDDVRALGESGGSEPASEAPGGPQGASDPSHGARDVRAAPRPSGGRTGPRDEAAA